MHIERFEKNGRTSQAVVDGDTIYLSGQVAANAEGEGARSQTAQALAAIDALLAQCGSSRSNVLRAIVYLADRSDFDEMNAAWTDWVDGDNPPARATIQATLLDPDWKVEIVATARR